MSWMVTQLYSDVASRPTRSRRAAVLSVTGLQPAGAGSGLDTKRTSPWIRTRGLQQQQLVTLRHHTKYQDRLNLEDYVRLFAARPEAVSVGSYAWILRAVQRLSACLRGARPQQQSVRVFARISARTINLFFSRRKTVSICQVNV